MWGKTPIPAGSRKFKRQHDVIPTYTTTRPQPSATQQSPAPDIVRVLATNVRQNPTIKPQPSATQQSPVPAIVGVLATIVRQNLIIKDGMLDMAITAIAPDPLGACALIDAIPKVVPVSTRQAIGNAILDENRAEELDMLSPANKQLLAAAIVLLHAPQTAQQPVGQAQAVASPFLMAAHNCRLPAELDYIIENREQPIQLNSALNEVRLTWLDRLPLQGYQILCSSIQAPMPEDELTQTGLKALTVGLLAPSLAAAMAPFCRGSKFTIAAATTALWGEVAEIEALDQQ